MDTKQITCQNPVVAFMQPEREYRAADGVNQSAMKALLTSPAHYLAEYGPNAEPRFPTAAMIWGSAFHAKVLEPEAFDNLFYDRSQKAKDPTITELKVMLDESNIEYPKTAKKAELEALLWPEGKKPDRRTSLDSKDYEGINRAADALRSHDITGEWFCPGVDEYRRFNEVSLYVKSESGLIMKGRFDRMIKSEDTVTILDLKTTQDASFKGFQRSVVNFSYDLQAAWYIELAKRAYPGTQIEFIFCAIEKRAPYGIGVFRASDELIQSGVRKMNKAIDLYQQCTVLDYWPSYDPIVHELTLPPWAVGAEEEDSEF